MSTLEVYGIEMSPPCRAVLITCDMIGKQYELKTVDITKGDHQTPEYLAVSNRGLANQPQPRYPGT